MGFLWCSTSDLPNFFASTKFFACLDLLESKELFEATEMVRCLSLLSLCFGREATAYCPLSDGQEYTVTAHLCHKIKRYGVYHV